jgi:phosphopantothenoylcysteine decarboxylase/phosphopantothenate--cysteine ligase
VLSVQDLAGKRVVVTAGPTFEAIDPVRFVGNRSSGKMGAAIAAAAQRRGAEVTLVLGPSGVARPVGVTVVDVESAQDATRVARHSEDRRHRGDGCGHRRLSRRETREGQAQTRQARCQDVARARREPDLLAELGKQRGSAKSPVLVGFAAETLDVVANAQAKLVTKRCDRLVVARYKAGSGFATETNRVTLVDASGATELPQASKSVVAHRILDRVVAMLAPTKKRR